MTSLMDQLKRLERAGQESSRATEKLCIATRDVAQHVADQLGAVARIAEEEGQEFSLGRGYTVDSTSHGPILLSYAGTCDGEVLNRDPAYTALPSRAAALAFAKDLAEGLLTELTETCEHLASDAATAEATLIQRLPTQDDDRVVYPGDLIYAEVQ